MPLVGTGHTLMYLSQYIDWTMSRGSVSDAPDIHLLMRTTVLRRLALNRLKGQVCFVHDLSRIILGASPLIMSWTCSTSSLLSRNETYRLKPAGFASKVVIARSWIRYKHWVHSSSKSWFVKLFLGFVFDIVGRNWGANIG